MEFLPETLSASIAGNTLMTLLGFGAGVFATMLVGRLVQWLLRVKAKAVAGRSDNRLDDVVLEALEGPIYYLLLAVGVTASIHVLVLPEVVEQTVRNIATVVCTVFIAWGLTRLQDRLKTTFVQPWAEATHTKLDDQIVPILDKTIKVMVWSMAILISFSSLGYDIISLLTGLGIGGLAVAMAAQDTLSNVFGSVTIFADQPFQVEDLITIGGHTGVVAEVGLRTSRIRTLDDTLVSIPNSNMVAQPVENRSAHRSAWRYHAILGLEYSTSATELRRAIEALKQILDEHPRISEHVVRFMSFGDSALEIQVAYWMEPREIPAYLDTIHDVNLAIKDKFDAEGWSMAFPSTTVYLGEPVRLESSSEPSPDRSGNGVDGPPLN